MISSASWSDTSNGSRPSRAAVTQNSTSSSSKCPSAFQSSARRVLCSPDSASRSSVNRDNPRKPGLHRLGVHITMTGGHEAHRSENASAVGRPLDGRHRTFRHHRDVRPGHAVSRTAHVVVAKPTLALDVEPCPVTTGRGGRTHTLGEEPPVRDEPLRQWVQGPVHAAPKGGIRLHLRHATIVYPDLVPRPRRRQLRCADVGCIEPFDPYLESAHVSHSGASWSWIG